LEANDAEENRALNRDNQPSSRSTFGTIKATDPEKKRTGLTDVYQRRRCRLLSRSRLQTDKAPGDPDMPRMTIANGTVLEPRAILTSTNNETQPWNERRQVEVVHSIRHS